MPSNEKIEALLRACDESTKVNPLSAPHEDCDCDRCALAAAAAAVRAELAPKPVELNPLRDTFAAAALTGCLAYSHVNPARGNYQENSTPDAVAFDCYAYADAMMVARAVRGETK